jgi:hypothetical protein
MEQSLRPLRRNYIFKASRRRHPLMLAAVVLSSWLVSSLCLMLIDGSFAEAIGWPWSREAIALVLVPTAGLIWLAMPRRFVRIVLHPWGLERITGRGRWRKTDVVAWRDIDTMELRRSGLWSKRLDVTLRPCRSRKRPVVIHVVKTRSTAYLPKLLSAIADAANGAGYRVSGDLIDARLSGHEAWRMTRRHV